MKRSRNQYPSPHGICAAIVALVLAGSISSTPAAAQDIPDMREILPYMMLVVDTSGSMEYLPGCQCTTLACTECLPDCDLANDAGGVPPQDPGPPVQELKKNRWSLTLEALTGTINNFECEPLPRTAANGMTYDVGYSVPYHQPWECASQADGTACAGVSVSACSTDSDCSINYPYCDPSSGRCSAFVQQQNGILDSYASRIRFGLMTFDGHETYVPEPRLVPVDAFDTARSEDEAGLWSYGGAKTFHYPNCVTDYMMDSGGRSSIADEGELISLDACDDPSPGMCPTWCPACPPGSSSITQPSNLAIQEALIAARPFGGTPIAASLDDLYYHLNQGLADTYGSCRQRYALLITDGYPDPDYRNFDCNCANEGDPSDWTRCDPNPVSTCTSDPDSCTNHPSKMHCPYPLAEEAAYDLVHGRGSDDPPLQKLFVVGLDVDDTVIESLDLIAQNGGSEDTDEDGHEALFASDISQLLSSLSTVLDGVIEPISRTVPVFAFSNTGGQYQISTGFEVSAGLGEPWTGIIERRRFECVNGILDENVTITPEDQFHVQMNEAGSRSLLSALPDQSGTATASDHLYFGTGSTCASACALTELSASSFTPEHFGLPVGDTAGRQAVLDWMYGINGSVRQDKRLGDVYHSRPAVSGTPLFDTSDESFNLFRDSPLVAGRPLVMYVGSNDGIINAIAVEDYTPPGTSPPSGATSLDPGQTLWGFVPPMFLERLSTNLDTHQFLADGSPVVKNVYFSRTAGSAAVASDYHTVLVTGMRSGGPGYVALDVTNPFEPVFLWQFTDPEMGSGYAQPAIVQAVFRKDLGASSEVKNGAVAIIPGGAGTLGVSGISGDCSDGVTNPGMKTSTSAEFSSDNIQSSGTTALDHRASVRCWRNRGRSLYFVDVEDGQLIKKINLDSSDVPVFPSPLVSTPAAYPADIGTLTSRAFITDADGVIWRVDMTATDPDPDDPMAGWTARPFHDMFYDAAYSAGEVSYEAPILSVDEDGQVVVIVGTGDTDDFTKPAVENRVVSLTEIVDPSQTSLESIRASINWEMMVRPDNAGLVPSELVTGTMGLFDGTLFFASFIPVSAGGDACDLGRGRVHAVHYVNRSTTLSENPSGTSTPLLLDLANDTDANNAINIAATDAIENFMVLGLGITQRPTCTVVDPAPVDVYGVGINPVSAIEDPAIYLVAQAAGDAGEVAKRAASQLGTMELRLKKRSSMSRVSSWATTVE